MSNKLTQQEFNNLFEKALIVYNPNVINSFNTNAQLHKFLKDNQFFINLESKRVQEVIIKRNKALKAKKIRENKALENKIQKDIQDKEDINKFMEKAKKHIENIDVRRKKQKVRNNLIESFIKKTDHINFKLIKTTKFLKKSGIAFDYVCDSIQNSGNEIIIANAVKKVFDIDMKYALTNFKQGFRILLKLIFTSTLGNYIGVTINDDDDFSIESIVNKIIVKVSNQFHDEEMNYSANFVGMTTFIIGLETIGGCCNRTHVEEVFKYKERTVKLINLKSSNENCLFMCFLHHLKIPGNTINLKKLRKDLDIKEGVIEFTKLIKYLNILIVLMF